MDENFAYELVEETSKFAGVVGHHYRMYSQKWLNESYYYLKSDKGAVWSHQVTIWVPDELDPDLAHASFLAIGGGNYGPEPNYNYVEQKMIRTLAVLTKSITVFIRLVFF